MITTKHPSRTGRLASILAILALLATAGLVSVGAQPAVAAPSSFQMPVQCGEVWRGATYNDHGSKYSQTSYYPLDLNSDKGDTWEYGHPAVASASGTVVVVGSQFPGYGNYVEIDHGAGWKTLYGHLSATSVTNGQLVAAGQQIGLIGDSGLQYKDAQGVLRYYTAPADSHLHYEQVYNNVLQPISFNGAAITYNFVYNGTAYTSANCPTAGSYGDRTILRATSNGSLYVMAGGAKFVFGTMAEFSGLGYSTAGMINVSDQTLAAIPNVPRNNTALLSGGGQPYVTAGEAKFPFFNMDEFHNQGHRDTDLVKVPQAPLDLIGDAPGNRPANRTVVQAPGGALYVVGGGVKWGFGSMGQYYGLGYGDSDVVRVSSSAFGIPDATTTSPPRNGTLLRDDTGTVYVMAGGVRFTEASWDELVQLYGSALVITAVPPAQLASFGTAPTAVPPDETLLQGTDATVWVIKSGQRRSFVSLDQFTSLGYDWSNIVRVPNGPLNSLPNGGNL